MRGGDRTFRTCPLGDGWGVGNVHIHGIMGTCGVLATEIPNNETELTTQMDRKARSEVNATNKNIELADSAFQQFARLSLG